MALWLHEASHDAKAGEQLSSVCPRCHTGYDGVIGPFAWGQGVGVGGV